MSSFYATAAANTPTPPPAPDKCDNIANDGWFPDIALADVRACARIDNTVTDARLHHALLAAMLDVNGKLRHWQQRQQAQGHDRLSAVAAPTVGAVSTLLTLYQRAVYCAAKADLLERYRDFDTTAEGHKKADLMTAAIDEQRRNAQWAIADIEGRSRVTVELI